MRTTLRPTTHVRRRRLPRLWGGGAIAAAAAWSITAGCRRTPSGNPAVCATGAAVTITTPQTPVGFDSPFALTAIALCPEARAGRITWRQIGGAAVRELDTRDDGFTLHARTPSMTDTVGAPLPWGIVPLSPRTRGELVLEAVWRDDRGHQEKHQIQIAAAPRSRGLPNTPVSARVYLGGTGWHVVGRPGSSGAEIANTDGVTSFLPDVSGDFHLRDGGGRNLALRAARYDETPLDCGRSGCHQAITDAAASSPMTTVLARGLSPGPGGHEPAFGPGYPDCAIACHATGEPGLPDGGFTHVAAGFGAVANSIDPRARRWADLPRPLRRLGGVGCLACHGPGALPEASARWGILRTGVCATCHDAPPRYGHVVAWGGTAMSRSDRDPRAATDRSCVRCHTTWGFLASLTGSSVDRRPPSDDDGVANVVGIACAACHAVHDPVSPDSERGAQPVPALLRAPPVPAWLGEIAEVLDKSRVCLGCHTPDQTEAAPSASAAALWLGRGGIDPATGDALNGPAPHATVAGGCIGCHRGGPAELARGANHGFSAGPRVCAPCHARTPAPTDLRARALRLWTQHKAAGQSDAPVDTFRPPHANAKPDRLQVPRPTPTKPNTPVERALWNLALIVEDPAAEAHNAPYARMLLDAAMRALSTPMPASSRRQE